MGKSKQKAPSQGQMKGETKGKKSQGASVLNAGVVCGLVLILISMIAGGILVGLSFGPVRQDLNQQMWDAMGPPCDIDEVIRLIGKGADPNHHDGKSGNTPLLEMVHFGRFEGVRELVKHGANVNLANHGGTRPMHVAAYCGASNAEEGDEAGLKKKVHKTCVPMLRLLLELGADPNVKLTSRGDLTPLHYMIQKGSVEGVRLLLENGADPNAQMSGHAQGSTSFHIVKELNDPELAAPLLTLLTEYGGVWTEAPPAPDFEPTCSA